MADDKFLLSQAMLAVMAKSSPSTISRIITKLDLKGSDSKERKKYNFTESRKLLREIIGKEFKINKKIQVFFNFKGGTGKTSICHQMAVHMSLFGYKTLAIDCDPQAHLTHVLGVEEEEENLTLYDIIVNNLPAREAITNIYPGLDLIPSDISLTRIESALSSKPNREKTLDKALKPLKEEYDFIFFDTNPTISLLNQNATYCTDVINIVCETQPLSLKGLDILIRELNDFSRAMEVDIPYRIIPNKYESKTATSQEVLGSLHHDHRDTVMESIVRRSEDINQSSKRRMPVCAFAKKRSMAFEDMCDLSLAILKTSSTKLS